MKLLGRHTGFLKLTEFLSYKDGILYEERKCFTLKFSIEYIFCVAEVYGSIDIGTNNDVNERKAEEVKG